MSGAFVFILVLVVGGFIVRHLIKKTKRRVGEWSLAAQSLGLDYVPAGLPFQTGVIHGDCQGMWVNVTLHSERSGRNSTTYTRYVVQYPERLPLELRLTRQGFFHGVATLFGVQDIEVGDPEFDALVIIKGDDEEAVREFLTPARRAEIAALYARFERVSIDSGQIVSLALGACEDHEALVDAVEALVNGAHVLCDEAALWDLGRARVVLEPYAPPVPVWESVRATDPGVGVAPAHPTPVEEPTLPAEVDEPLLEPLADERPTPVDAAAAFTELADTSPGFAELVEDDSSATEPVRQVEPAPAGTASGAGDLCQALFGDSASGYEIDQRFGSFAGEAIRWSGTLTDVQGFDLDFELGSGAGTRAVLEVHEVVTALGTTDPIKAVVRFPEGLAERLKSRIGQRVAFTGRLAAVKGLMKELIVLDGELAI